MKRGMNIFGSLISIIVITQFVAISAAKASQQSSNLLLSSLPVSQPEPWKTVVVRHPDTSITDYQIFLNNYSQFKSWSIYLIEEWLSEKNLQAWIADQSPYSNISSLSPWQLRYLSDHQKIDRIEKNQLVPESLEDLTTKNFLFWFDKIPEGYQYKWSWGHSPRLQFNDDRRPSAIWSYLQQTQRAHFDIENEVILIGTCVQPMSIRAAMSKKFVGLFPNGCLSEIKDPLIHPDIRINDLSTNNRNEKSWVTAIAVIGLGLILIPNPF